MQWKLNLPSLGVNPGFCEQFHEDVKDQCITNYCLSVLLIQNLTLASAA